MLTACAGTHRLVFMTTNQKIRMSLAVAIFSALLCCSIVILGENKWTLASTIASFASFITVFVGIRVYQEQKEEEDPE